MNRCPWAGDDELYIKYHDLEWGVPVYDDKIQFEFLVLESAQAGLSWITILRKRENYRDAYNGFNPEVVAAYDEQKVEELLSNKGIVRNRKKIEASINNAQRLLEIQQEFGSFCNYIWSFTNNEPVINNWTSISDLPAHTSLSDEITKDIKRRGFSFLGTTIIYSHLQAVGIVNDHILSCFRHKEVQGGSIS